jgi:hypothetical protein
MNIGIVLFMIGIIPWTIGGMISFATQYDIHNRHLRAELDPKRHEAQKRVTFAELWGAYFNNPKSKWWCRIGFAMCTIGMIIIVVEIELSKIGRVSD